MEGHGGEASLPPSNGDQSASLQSEKDLDLQSGKDLDLQSRKRARSTDSLTNSEMSADSTASGFKRVKVGGEGGGKQE